MDFGTRKAAGSAAGFIDFFGYIRAGMAGSFQRCAH
jgi:sugar phosphate permease